MAVKRLFRPALVCPLGGYYLAVDEVQPVAVIVSQAGKILDVGSWEHLEPPATGSAWPRRRLSFNESTAWLSDLPDGPSAALRIDSTAQLSVSQSDPPEASAQTTTRYSKYSLSHSSNGSNSTHWTYLSQLDWFHWNSGVQLETGTLLHTWDLGSGSITSYATVEATTAVCVRRAHKRPWGFRAPYDLYLLSGVNSGDHSPIRVAPLDISSRRWVPASSASDHSEVIARYLKYSLAEYQAALRAGARAVKLDLEGLDVDPVIELSFTLDSTPGIRYRRIDRPLNELGIESGGLRDLGIFLEEDLSGGVVAFGGGEGRSELFI